MTLSIQRRGFSVAVLSSRFLPHTVMAQGQAPLEIGLLPNISARTLLSQYRPLREVPPGVLAAMDAYVNFTRDLLARTL